MLLQDIHEGHTYAGKGADSSFTRKVLAIDERRQEARTEVYRDGKLIGESLPMSLPALARWASADVTEEVTA